MMRGCEEEDERVLEDGFEEDEVGRALIARWVLCPAAASGAPVPHYAIVLGDPV